MAAHFSLVTVLLAALLLFGYFWWRKRRKGREKQKYHTSRLTEERAREILSALLKLMKEEEVYLDSEITLTVLATKLAVHYNHLSQIIHERLAMSFNDFINQYRIEKAKALFMDADYADSTILDIAYEVGFSSKSVFNTAFKKFTGLTPSQFRKSL